MAGLKSLRGLKGVKKQEPAEKQEKTEKKEEKKKTDFSGVKKIPASTIKQYEEGADKILEEMSIKGKVAKFIKEFVIDFKPEQAAKRAGYKSPKYGFKLIKESEVLNAIHRLLDAEKSNELVTASFLRGQMAIYAQSNIADYFDVNGDFKGFDQISRAQSSCIQSFHKKFNKEGRPEYKITLYDAIKANELIGRAYQLYEKPNEDPKEFDDMGIDEILDYLDGILPSDAIEKLRGDL